MLSVCYLQGFCPPAEYSDETEGEGATEFQDIQDGGLGEGEGVKDVSDQIESEDQLEDARQAGEEQQEDNSQQQDLPAEDNAIEMSDDFQGKMHDLEKQGYKLNQLIKNITTNISVVSIDVLV